MTRPIHFMVSMLLSLGSFQYAGAQCNGACSSTVLASSDSYSYNLDHSRLRIPAGTHYEGDIYISEGSVVENYGTLSGRIILQGGQLNNNGMLQPSEISLLGGRFSNYGSFTYSKDIMTGDAALLIENYGDMTLTRDLMLTNATLLVFGNCSVRDLISMQGSRVELYGHSTLKLENLDIYDSLIVINPTCSLNCKALRVHESGYLEANGALMLERNVKVDGKFFVNDNIQVEEVKSTESGDMSSIDQDKKVPVSENGDNTTYSVFSGVENTDEGKDMSSRNRVRQNAKNAAKSEIMAVKRTMARMNTSPFGEGQMMRKPFGSKLISFTAEHNNTLVTLNWTTAREFNSSHFEVEVMEDNKSWVIASKIQAKGTSDVQNDYSFSTILESNPAVAYFRLKLVDIDGRFEYSPVLRVNIDAVRPADSYMINTSNEKIDLSYKSKASKRMKIEQLDNMGTIIRNIADTESQPLIADSGQLISYTEFKSSEAVKILR